jgi:hypothetical protein
LPNFENLEGQRFGKLLVIDRAENIKGRTAWLCACDCGKETIVLGKQLKNKMAKSCGCLRTEKLLARTVKHMATSNGKQTSEYKCWAGMKKRCYNPKNKEYKNYGGRGIKVCDRWQSFENFLADMGYKPSPEYSIERKNVGGDYEPGNCIWIPLSEQCDNKQSSHLVTAFGETKTMKQWAQDERCVVGYSTLRGRLSLYGWSPEKAIISPNERTRDILGRYANEVTI